MRPRSSAILITNSAIARSLAALPSGCSAAETASVQVISPNTRLTHGVAEAFTGETIAFRGRRRRWAPLGPHPQFRQLPLQAHDGVDLSITAGSKILLIEFQSGNYSSGTMQLDPSTTLFNVYDGNTDTYLLGGQSDAHSLDYWLAAYPGLTNRGTWVGVEMGEGGTGSAATMVVTGADYETRTAIPEPSSLMLLGSGVAGLAGLLRRKLRA
jgi:hypothetical protein